MKWQAVAIATVVAAASGCAPAAFVLRGASQTSAEDLSRCAMRQLERMRYTIREGRPESGTIRATKATSTTRRVLSSGIDSEDRIVVTTEVGGQDGGGTMRVAGESVFWRRDGGRIAQRPSADVARHASGILEACGILDAVRVEAR